MARMFTAILLVLLTIPVAAEPAQTRQQWFEAKVEAQQAELERLNGQLKRLPRPPSLDALLDKILLGLEEAVRQDLPFHRDKRLARLDRLKQQLKDEQLESAEKLRRLFRLYRDEVELGQNLEAWDGELNDSASGKIRLVTFLRYGRLALVYQSFDGQETAWWDRGSGSWKPLSAQLAREVSQGIRVALKRVPPDLLIVPVKGAEQ